MTSSEVIKWLNSIIEEYPDRIPAEESIPFIVDQVKGMIPQNRDALLESLRIWLKENSNPSDWVRVNLAMAIAAAYQLNELKPDIEALLNRVKSGRAFRPYYVAFIERHLKSLG